MRNKAFTLIELLVVIAIVALLIAIVTPALAIARQQCMGVACLSNLRQMEITASTYTSENNEYYPLAQFTRSTAAGDFYVYEWDFTKIYNLGVCRIVTSGLLWQKDIDNEIQQCTSFKGASNAPNDPYTGYNYNSSYIGGIMNSAAGVVTGQNSSKTANVGRPSSCAIFGDGECVLSGIVGANKFMRSPWVGKLDADDPGLRPYGTQGYRHLKKTNVVYCDGSAFASGKRYTDTYPSLQPLVAQGTGFLSADNSAYDLE